MFERKIIKYFFIISCLIAISFPMVNTYYVLPTFSALLSKNAENESVNIAQHLSLNLLEGGDELKVPDTYVKFLEDSKEDFNLSKIKLFLDNGEVIYSSDPKNIGDLNKKSYFHEIVAKGHTYSKLAQKETESLEGQLLTADVVETYVPIMKNGKFLGAFELYLDITKQHGSLQRAVFNSSVISFIIMFGFFLITGILLLIENRRTPGPEPDQDLKAYQSPLNLLLISIVSLFIAEIIVIMIVSTFPAVSSFKEAMIDGALLVMVASPSLYFFLFHPLLLHINKRKESEDRVKRAYDEISNVNNQLENEIVERKRAEAKIIQSQKEWESTFDIMTDAITIHDKDFNIIKSNKAAEKLLDLPFLKTSSTKCYKFYHGSDTPMEGCPSCDCARTGEAASFELYEPHLKRQIEIRAMPRFDSNGNINGTIHLVRDITERKNMEEKLKIMSVTDELTGLYNRRGFFTMLEQQLKIIKRQNDKAYMLYIDIDNFKSINDTLGHSTGDSVLIDAVNILKSTYRESDIIARIGGDEFVVFPAGNNESNLNKVIDRLQANIDIYNATKKRGYTLSMSVGISVYDSENPRSTDDLLAEADRSMYENKKQKKKV